MPAPREIARINRIINFFINGSFGFWDQSLARLQISGRSLLINT
jgi:hypothetical protein